MNLLAEIRLSSANARDTSYVPVVVDAADGGDAQRKAMEIAQAENPNVSVSGGPVCPATDEAIAAAEEKLGCAVLRATKKTAKVKVKPAPQMGVKPHPFNEGE